MEITLFSLIIYIIASVALVLAVMSMLKTNNTTLVVNQHSANLITSGIIDEEENEFSSFALSAVSPPQYILDKGNLNKTHIMDGGSHIIVLPDECVDWEGEIKIVNRDNVSDTIDFSNLNVSLMIVEFSNSTTGYSNEVIPIEGNSHVYQNVSGKFDFNNYILHIHIHGGKIVITGKGLIVDNFEVS